MAYFLRAGIKGLDKSSEFTSGFRSRAQLMKTRESVFGAQETTRKGAWKRDSVWGSYAGYHTVSFLHSLLTTCRLNKHQHLGVPKTGGPQYRPQNIKILIVGTPKMVPLV